MRVERPGTRRGRAISELRLPATSARGIDEIAEGVGKDWKQSAYYDLAEDHIDEQWRDLVWPMIESCDFSCVVDLAAGHGRNTAKLLPLARKLYVVDINRENIDFCRARFLQEQHIEFICNNGYQLERIPDRHVTLVYCFDAMVHFDSDVVRAYLREFSRVLAPGGEGFCHHSNYTGNPSGSFRDSPGWRNYMSSDLFEHYCAKEGLEVLASKVIDWDTPEQDCLTRFRKPR